MNEEALSLLTPGSVWLKQDGKQVKVLWITNTTLSAKQQAMAPIQIVYSNEDGNVYSRTVESFLKVHQFWNVDPELENKLENLIVFNEEDYEGEGDALDPEDQDDDEEEEGSITLTPISTEQVVAQELKVEETNPLKTKTLADFLSDDSDVFGRESEPEVIQFIMTEGLEAALTSDELQAALVSCSQEPNDGMNMTKHKLTFQLQNRVTLQALKDVFIPDDDRAIVEAWTINSGTYQDAVAWDAYIGVFPEIVYGHMYGSVIVTTDKSPLISEEEAQAHIHNPAEDFASGIEMPNYMPNLLGNDPLTEEEEPFVPPMQVVQAPNSVEELNRLQAGPLNLIGEQSWPGDTDILSLGTVEVQNVTPSQ